MTKDLANSFSLMSDNMLNPSCRTALPPVMQYHSFFFLLFHRFNQMWKRSMQAVPKETRRNRRSCSLRCLQGFMIKCAESQLGWIKFCWIMSLQMYWRNTEWIKAWLEEQQTSHWLEDRMEKNRTLWQNAGSVFLCLPSFLWHWRHCLYMIMKISHTDWLNKVSALCAVLKKRTCRNTTHYFTHFSTSFWPHFTSAWRAIWNPTHPSCKPPLDNTFTPKIWNGKWPLQDAQKTTEGEVASSFSKTNGCCSKDFRGCCLRCSTVRTGC